MLSSGRARTSRTTVSSSPEQPRQRPPAQPLSSLGPPTRGPLLAGARGFAWSTRGSSAGLEGPEARAVTSPRLSRPTMRLRVPPGATPSSSSGPSRWTTPPGESTGAEAEVVAEVDEQVSLGASPALLSAGLVVGVVEVEATSAVQERPVALATSATTSNRRQGLGLARMLPQVQPPRERPAGLAEPARPASTVRAEWVGLAGTRGRRGTQEAVSRAAWAACRVRVLLAVPQAATFRAPLSSHGFRLAT